MHPYIWGQCLGKRRSLLDVGVWDCRISLQCSDTASHCFSIQDTEGEKERDRALESKEAGEEVEWAKQEHRGFWGWIRDREFLSIPALMPKLPLNQGCLLHRDFNGSSVIYLYSWNLFTLQVHWEKEIFIGDFYRCWRFVLSLIWALALQANAFFAR